jgi:hypothetical protein
MNRIIYPGIPFGVLLCGIAYLLLAQIYEWRWCRELFTEFSNAGIIFGALALTLEPFMRRAFARDVFRAAFGYHLPDDFKDEIARIAGHRVICTRHIMDVRIKEMDCDRDSVSVLVTVERHFTNISAYPVLHRASTWVDEWGFSKPTKINQCEIFDETGTRSKKFNARRIEYKPNLSFEAESPRMILWPNKMVRTIIEYEVVRRTNDFIYEQFSAPTRNPEIRIAAHNFASGAINIL